MFVLEQQQKWRLLCEYTSNVHKTSSEYTGDVIIIRKH